MNTAATNARTAMLERIRKALHKETSADLDAPPAAVAERLHRRPASTRPAIPGAGGDLTGALIANMEAAQTSVVRLQTLRDIPTAVAAYLEEHAITGKTSVAPALAALAWPDDYTVGSASGSEATAITPCLAGIAETGSLAVVSSADTPVSLNFLPENHLIVLHESQIIGHMEALWPLLRALEPLPRATNLITGPSRTADIEQTLEIGAHGPRRVHVMLIAQSHSGFPSVHDESHAPLMAED